MDVSIEQIQFNHDLDSDLNDAITIRKNEIEDITLPEWMVGRGGVAERSAAAYARSRQSTRTIAVRLRRNNPAVQSVQVSVESVGILGNGVGKKPVVFSRDGLSNFELVELQSTRLGSAVVGRTEIEFEWTLQATLTNGQKPPPEKQTTKHIIYTLLGTPQPPWGPADNPGDFEPPWTEVLDLACEWAAGAKNTTEVASLITARVHEQAPQRLIYALGGSDSTLSINGTDEFDCTKLLKYLLGNTEPLRVNCTDCAIIVSSLANILGCNLFQSEMGYRFGTNPIRLIGFEGEMREPFEYHEVAWEAPCDSTAKLFDCCLKVDGDSEPAGGAFAPLLPVNIPFGEPGSDYHFRLAWRGTCEAQPSTKTRRRVARQTINLRRIHPKLERILRVEFDFSSWEKVPSPDRLFLGPIDNINEGFLPEGWTLDRTRVFNGEPDKVCISETFWQSGTSNDTSLRVLTYRFASVSVAREFLLNLLGGFQLPLVKQRSGLERNSGFVAVGELAFSVPEELVLLFARSNLVIYIQNAGSATASVSTFAHEIDKRISDLLRADENLTSIQTKEKNLMLPAIIDGKWSSTRPLPNGSPNPSTPDGVFDFKTYDPFTGKVTGVYYDVQKLEIQPFEGSLKLNVNDTHAFLLHHLEPLFTQYRRVYEGHTVANGRVIVVAGRWRRFLEDKAINEEIRRAAEAAFDGQDEGVWVATKP